MPKKFFLTTAIDYPNSRPHIGTAFEKLGADVQARYRRMEGDDVFFLMGNDENTLKVAKRAAELGQSPQAYCDDMANQFKQIWGALDISYDTFIQTSHERHKQCCRKFIQKVYDNGHIYQGTYEGWYCDGCEEFKTDKQHADTGGVCANHKTPLTRRSEPCYFFALSKFQDRLLKYYEENPDFIQPESRRNEMISLIKTEGLLDVNVSRRGEEWGIRIPFDEEYTIYVWFDAVLTYITGIGYGDDEALFSRYYPCDTHFIGKDITRFHCALWPAMLWAAGLEAPRKVFAHGFVYIKGEKISKSLGNAIEPMDIITQFSADAFRYYFMRECPFPGDGDFSWDRFTEVFNSELANKLGNQLSRSLTLITKNYEGVLAGTGVRGQESGVKGQAPAVPDLDLPAFVAEVRGHVEACRYNQALQTLVLNFLTPTDQYLETNAPWKLVKSDKEAAKKVLFNAVQSLRVASILLKPFIPRSAEAIYRSFNFPTPWEQVNYAAAAALTPQLDDLRVTAELVDGKVKPLFPRIEAKNKSTQLGDGRTTVRSDNGGWIINHASYRKGGTMAYVDGFVLPVPKKNVKAYARMSKLASKVWMKHGALEYRECVGDDLKIDGMLPFTKLAETKPTETVVFAWILYKSKAHRDRVNAKVMKDPQIGQMMQGEDMPFDVKRMAYGGFKVFVEGKPRRGRKA